MKLFNAILQGYEATESNAYELARGFDWSQAEITEQPRPTHSHYIDNINGVSIWYDYGADYYFFENDKHANNNGYGQ